MDATAAVWASLRATRADRPRKAAPEGKRCDVYLAALEQFEQLMRAAADVGYASRPLLLYYALNQAGRAIAAALVEQPWMLQRHGLKVILQPQLLLSDVRPDPGANDAFSRLCVTGHGALVESCTLGALYASLPDLAGADLPDEFALPRPIPVVHADLALQDDAMLPVNATVEGLPDRVFSIEDEASRESAISAELARYPAAREAERIASATAHGSVSRMLLLRWESKEPGVLGRQARLNEVAPLSRDGRTHWLRPGLNTTGDTLSPLMSWWALLFALSVVARYHPREWAVALRVKNVLAVPLEIALDLALEAVPHYALEAILERQLYL